MRVGNNGQKSEFGITRGRWPCKTAGGSAHTGPTPHAIFSFMEEGATPVPTIAYCEIRHRLLREVADAVSELAAIQNEHFEASLALTAGVF